MGLIFGSTAIKYWFKDYTKNPNDLDVISLEDKPEHYWVESFQYIIDNNLDNTYVDPNFLYTIKMSHMGYDINWNKHMKDIIFLKQKGCVLDTDLYRMLEKDWEKVHKNKRGNIKIKGEPNQFFKSNITRKYNHDELHKLVMYNDTPMHNLIRPNPNMVNVSKKLWDNLTEEQKIQCATEEVMVFALERYENVPTKNSLILATKNVIMASRGWFHIYLLDNWENIIYNKDIINRINKAKEKIKC